MSRRTTRSKTKALCQSTSAPSPGPNTTESQTSEFITDKPESEQASTTTITATYSAKPKRPKKVHKKVTEEEYYESRMTITNDYLHELLAVLGYTIVDGEVSPAHSDARVNEAIRLYLDHAITSSQTSSKATTPSAPSE